MVIAFLVTAAVTFCTVIFAYVTDSIPHTTLNVVDYWFVDGIRGFLRLKPREKIPEDVRDGWKRVVQKFTLALSDQQLVTGLAVLIAGFYKRCTMSTYHFSIVISLAWLSSTVHLSTLVVLRDYFIRSPFLRSIRVVGMLSMLCLLFVAEFLTDSPAFVLDPSRCIQCSFAEFDIRKLFHSISLADSFSQFGILMFLILAYGNKIVSLHSSDPNLTMQGWLLREFKQKQPTPSVQNMQDLDVELSRMWDRVLCLRTKHYHSLDQQQSKPKWWTKLSTTVFAMLIGFQESFLWQILWLTFGNTWGFAQVYSVRWQTAPTVIGNENELGFGQLVPLLLLALPLLAAIEGYMGMILQCQLSSPRH